MPKPKPNEAKQDYLKRCTRELIDSEGKEADQAFAMCNSYWDQAKKKTKMEDRACVVLSAPVELSDKQQGTEGANKFYSTVYTGKPIDLGWMGKLIFDVNGMTTKAKFPVLRQHQADRIVGVADKAWAEDGRLHVSGTISDYTQDATDIRNLAKEGFPWQMSVGIWPLQIKRLRDEKETETVNGNTIEGPIEIWQKSLVGEVSFVALGADDDTAAITLSDEKRSVEIEYMELDNDEDKTIGGDIMPMTREKLEAEAPDLLKSIEAAAESKGYKEGHDVGLEEGRTIGLESGRKEATELERKRIIELMNAEADPEETKKAIENGVSLDSAYKQFYAAEKQKRANGLKELEKEAPADPGRQGSTDTKDSPTYETKLAELEESGKTRAEAVKLIVQNFPKLHEDFLSRQRAKAAQAV